MPSPLDILLAYHRLIPIIITTIIIMSLLFHLASPRLAFFNTSEGSVWEYLWNLCVGRIGCYSLSTSGPPSSGPTKSCIRGNLLLHSFVLLSLCYPRRRQICTFCDLAFAIPWESHAIQAFSESSPFKLESTGIKKDIFASGLRRLKEYAFQE